MIYELLNTFLFHEILGVFCLQLFMCVCERTRNEFRLINASKLVLVVWTVIADGWQTLQDRNKKKRHINLASDEISICGSAVVHLHREGREMATVCMGRETDMTNKYDK